MDHSSFQITSFNPRPRVSGRVVFFEGMILDGRVSIRARV